MTRPLESLPRAQIDSPKTRVHGDYHLGQILWSLNDYILLDFEGEPAKSIEQRRAKHSPVKDVVGMLRSFGYAAFAGLFEASQDRASELDGLASGVRLRLQRPASELGHPRQGLLGGPLGAHRLLLPRRGQQQPQSQLTSTASHAPGRTTTPSRWGRAHPSNRRSA